MRRNKSGPIARLASTAVPAWQAEPHNEVRNYFIGFLVLISVLVKYAISLSTHSGQGSPPMFGDYEAQRHWMEITVHLPTNEWYRNSTNNDLQYWGLDYPPGSAYFAKFFGHVAHNFFDPEWVALHTSRGIETAASKVFMRLSVICADLVFYVPAALMFAFSSTLHRSRSWAEKFEGAACLLFNPANLLVDHGHFQYNGVSLGMAMAAVVAFDKDRPCLAAFFFSCSLNFKQMNLYLALPFFFALLSYSIYGGFLKRGRKKTSSAASKTSVAVSWWWTIACLAKIGGTVIATFALHWLPLCLFAAPATPESYPADGTCGAGGLDGDGNTCAPVENTCGPILLGGLKRLFPFNRGLFEDKVANIWCSVDPVLKLRNRTSLQPYLPLLATVATLVLSLPAAFALLRRPPTTRTFLYALATTGLAFFMCSFQVHEKSILVPLMPITLLALEVPSKSMLFIIVSTFSMWPLLQKDGLEIQYIVLMFVWIVLGRVGVSKSQGGWISRAVLFGGAACHALPLLVDPPAHLPHLWVLLLCVYSCALFGLFYLYLVFRMLREK